MNLDNTGLGNFDLEVSIDDHLMVEDIDSIFSHLPYYPLHHIVLVIFSVVVKCLMVDYYLQNYKQLFDLWPNPYQIQLSPLLPLKFPDHMVFDLQKS